ncbi:hypothetical protein predicted by Glimmer/Critica [Sorangium cellulosum So ce56]|uniref:Peptidase M12A domain-containing protein n=1 Tax=Sorangium cellulosum (strain So ce56) TaxID=448385 RepID=A9G423_SORC5|nr:hypothetical protein predicted by Glimmer/Critica [Sorangium cellulosum So ce56]
MLRFERALSALSLTAVCALSACAVDTGPSEAEADPPEASEDVAGARAPLVRVNANWFWPDGKVPYCFDADFPPAWVPTVHSAIENMERRLPIDFTHVRCDAGQDDYVRFIQGFGDTGGESEDTGWDEGEQDITIFSVPSESLVTHEMLHALGMYHEQSRSDREKYVTINWACIDSDKDHNYDTKSNTFTSGVYDYESIMHYRTGAWCASTPPAWCNVPDGSGTACATIVKKDGSLIGRNTVMSREDINSMYYMYSEPFPVADGDYAGVSVAVGDFDGDGYADVATGLPFKAVNGAGAAGEVRVYKGTSRGLYPWQTITQGDIGWVSRVNDRFGWTMAAADIDKDGRAELIVGAPYEAVDGLANAGAVAVLRPDDAGKLQAFRTYTQKTQGLGVVRANSYFGYGLAAGDFGRARTASGAIDPAWGLALAISAPGEASSRGAVYLFGQTNPTSGSPKHRTQRITGSANGDQFGFALAIGNVDDDTELELVVGSPYASSAHGQVDVFNGAAPAAASNLSAPMVTHWESVAAPEAATRNFGASLAVANFREDGPDEIAIGAPGTQNSTGAVYIFRKELVFADPNAFHLKQTILQNGAQEPGDEFGFALVAANVEPSTTQHELIIGAPGENDRAGAISVFRGGIANLQALQILQQSDITGATAQPFSRFGYALAAGSINGMGDSDVTSDQFNQHVGNPLRHIPDVVVGSPSIDSFSLFRGNHTVGLVGHAKH